MLDTARRIIDAKGLISLKVRDVAEAAGCSIGSVYNEFGDFDGLILTVNRETVQLLTSKLRAVPSDDPRAQLHGLAAGYLAFASEHTNLLRSLFEHRMENNRPFPNDILDMVMEAFALMYSPLSRLLTKRDPMNWSDRPNHVFSRARDHFARARRPHGRRTMANLRQQLARFVDAQLEGLGARVD